MGSGGRRPGAGRPGWRPKCERKLRLDVLHMARQGWLVPGNYGELVWSHSVRDAGSLIYAVTKDSVRLFYMWAHKRSDPVFMDCPVVLEWKQCNYGGRRPYFKCPRCDDRRVVLFGLASDGRFGCRGCMDLAYWSEALGVVDRTWQTQLRLEAKLTRKRRGRRPAMRIAGRIRKCEDRRFGALAPRLVRALS